MFLRLVSYNKSHEYWRCQLQGRIEVLLPQRRYHLCWNRKHGPELTLLWSSSPWGLPLWERYQPKSICVNWNNLSYIFTVYIQRRSFIIQFLVIFNPLKIDSQLSYFKTVTTSYLFMSSLIIPLRIYVLLFHQISFTYLFPQPLIIRLVNIYRIKIR